MHHLTAVPSTITDCTDVDRPGPVRRWGQDVSAAALEVEVLPVKGAVMSSTPGHACGRTLRDPGASQQTATHQWGELWVWSEEGSKKRLCETRTKWRISSSSQKLLLGCAHIHECSLTRKESVGTRQAGLVRGVSPAQSPQGAAAMLHGHEGRVMNSRELFTAPRRVTVTAHSHPWLKKYSKMGFVKAWGATWKSEVTCRHDEFLLYVEVVLLLDLTVRAAWSTPTITACPHCFVHHLALHLRRSEEDTEELPTCSVW